MKKAVTWFAVAQDYIKIGEIVAVRVDEDGRTTVRKIEKHDLNMSAPPMDWRVMEAEANKKGNN